MPSRSKRPPPWNESISRLADALADRAVDAIVDFLAKPLEERPKQLVVDVDFEDIDRKALPSHAKARRARSVSKQVSDPQDAENEKGGP